VIIVGSTAAKCWGVNRKKEPLDLDIWVSEHENFTTKADKAVLPLHILEAVPQKYGKATQDALYTIKCSHLQWDIKWDKTKLDILYMHSQGCKLIPSLYFMLVEHWKVEHGDKSYLSLSKNKDEFFDDHVKYKYDHDYLHELVSYPAKPLYLSLLKGDTVALDRGEFEKFTQEDKVRLFREEVTVIAFERWVVFDTNISWYKAHNLALKKVITSLTKNWASDFIIHNLESFTIPDYRYFKHILKTLKTGDYIMNKLAQENITDLYEEFMVAFPEGNYYDNVEGFIFELAEDNFHGVKLAWLEDKGYKHRMQEGGGEGEAEFCEAVFTVGDKNYSCNYAYYSHNGHEFDYILGTLEFVESSTKVVTVWS